MMTETRDASEYKNLLDAARVLLDAWFAERHGAAADMVWRARKYILAVAAAEFAAATRTE